MSKLRANISGIIKSSVIDGPGNRLVIFFQACNLNCMYCHNAHTIGLCNLCGDCVQACPTQSLKIDEVNKGMIYNEKSCIRCDKCLKICPESSSPFYKRMTVDDLISEILEVNDYISGITVSGGEVMLQAKFLKHLFESIKSHPELKKLSILVDSNGNVNQNQWELLINLVDGFMLDIKAYSSGIHQKITGYTNEKILNSIQYLNAKEKLKELRLVLVPGYNDDADEVKKIASLMKYLDPEVVKVLIKMRKHGMRKAYAFLSEPSDLQIENTKKSLEAFGLHVSVI